MVPLSPEAGQTSQQAGTALWFKAQAIFFLILIYVKIYASHQSEDSELWALTAILATKQMAMKRHSPESVLEKFAAGLQGCMESLAVSQR